MPPRGRCRATGTAAPQPVSALHFQTMLKTKLNVLTLRKEPLPTVIFHEPEAIELCTTTPLMKTRTHAGCKVTYLGKVSTTGMQFLSGCTEKPVIELWKKHTLAREDVYPANALLEIRPFQVWLHHLDLKALDLELGASELAPVALTGPASATARSNSPNDDGESSRRRCEEFFPVTGLSQQHVLFGLSICNHHRVSLSLQVREA
ncbi:PTB-containing, cubilin and LRP1-interacting protein isoform 4-T4 [Ciconia maguari]